MLLNHFMILMLFSNIFMVLIHPYRLFSTVLEMPLYLVYVQPTLYCQIVCRCLSERHKLGNVDDLRTVAKASVGCAILL